MYSRVDLQTHASSALYNSVTLTFYYFGPRVNACRAPIMPYMYANFGVDSSSRFLLERGQTHSHTKLQTPLTDRQTDTRRQAIPALA